MKTQNFNLENMGVQPMTGAEMQDLNGGGLLDGLLSFVNGTVGNATSAVNGSLNAISNLSIPGLITNASNLITGILGGVSNLVSTTFNGNGFLGIF